MCAAEKYLHTRGKPILISLAIKNSLNANIYIGLMSLQTLV